MLEDGVGPRTSHCTSLSHTHHHLSLSLSLSLSTPPSHTHARTLQGIWFYSRLVIYPTHLVMCQPAAYEIFCAGMEGDERCDHRCCGRILQLPRAIGIHDVAAVEVSMRMIQSHASWRAPWCLFSHIVGVFSHIVGVSSHIVGVSSHIVGVFSHIVGVSYGISPCRYWAMAKLYLCLFFLWAVCAMSAW
jgi:hypothetical protein